MEILGSKGNDYADMTDILKNFKEVAEICRILNIDSRSLYGTHLFYIILKLQRLCNLLTVDKDPKHESIEDTITDFRNYLALLNCSIQENNNNNKVAYIYNGSTSSGTSINFNTDTPTTLTYN